MFPALIISIYIFIASAQAHDAMLSQSPLHHELEQLLPTTEDQSWCCLLDLLHNQRREHKLSQLLQANRLLETGDLEILIQRLHHMRDQADHAETSWWRRTLTSYIPACLIPALPAVLAATNIPLPPGSNLIPLWLPPAVAGLVECSRCTRPTGSAHLQVLLSGAVEEYIKRKFSVISPMV